MSTTKAFQTRVNLLETEIAIAQRELEELALKYIPQYSWIEQVAALQRKIDSLKQEQEKTKTRLRELQVAQGQKLVAMGYKIKLVPISKVC